MVSHKVVLELPLAQPTLHEFATNHPITLAFHNIASMQLESDEPYEFGGRTFQTRHTFLSLQEQVYPSLPIRT